MITVVAFHVKKITKPKTINKDIVGRCINLFLVHVWPLEELKQI